MSKKQEIHLQPSHVAAYRFIEKYMKRKIVAPEILDISRALQITDRQVYRVLDDLQSLGYISRELHKKRSIKILKPMQ